MTTTALNEDLIAKFERRVELLTEVLELAQRQRKCVEQGKTRRLDRLIRRRDHALRQWRELEQALGPQLEPTRAGTLSADQKARLRTLISKSDKLVESITQQDDLIAEVISTRKTEMTDELNGLRKERETLHAYARDFVPGKKAGVDRSA